jgi:glycosyltransferase involved in cell wall biosynthesis
LKISVIIPAYEAYGRGVEFVSRGIQSVLKQTFQDFEIVVSDHSVDDKIRNSVKSLKNHNIIYIRNPKKIGSSSANMNVGIEHSTGDIIKPLFLDDYFYDANALQIIHNAFKHEVKWLVCGNISCDDTGKFFRHFIPKWDNRIIFGHNTLSTPSCIAYLRGKSKFDERLIWLMDCKMYQDLYDEYGLPYIEPKALIANFLHKDQYTHRMGETVKRTEEALIREEYKHLKL